MRRRWSYQRRAQMASTLGRRVNPWSTLEMRLLARVQRRERGSGMRTLLAATHWQTVGEVVGKRRPEWDYETWRRSLDEGRHQTGWRGSPKVDLKTRAAAGGTNAESHARTFNPSGYTPSGQESDTIISE